MRPLPAALLEAYCNPFKYFFRLLNRFRRVQFSIFLGRDPIFGSVVSKLPQKMRRFCKGGGGRGKGVYYFAYLTSA